MNESPLSDVKVESLQELFNKNPKDLTDAEIEKIVLVLRQQKGTFDQEELKPKRQKAKSDLKIEDLDL